ncbi:MAG: hypothetical protein WB791_02190 [Waddliaceae bacterium]
MVETPKKSIGKLARSFLLVIFAGVLVAFIVAGGMLYYFNPSSSYQVENILLSPNLVESLSFPDVDRKTGKSDRYVFGRVEFLYYAKEDDQWKRIKTDEEKYRRFYNLVSDERSLLVVPENIKRLFDRGNPAMLTIVANKVIPEGAKGESKAFQEVEFTGEGSYFRIRLHDDAQQVNWAYYYHPDIYREAVNIFVPKNGN